MPSPRNLRSPPRLTLPGAARAAWYTLLSAALSWFFLEDEEEEDEAADGMTGRCQGKR